MQEHYASRAIENYRRRIYDAWSVLNAANILQKASSKSTKQFKYNRFVLNDREAASE